MVITTVLVSIVMLVCWQWHWLAVAALTGFLFVMESVLLSAVMYKVQLCFSASLQA
jgi:KUP system potassium uptake protein